MCDTEEFVGRVLTTKRVKELNARDFFYKILRDMPNIDKIAPGVEDERLKGGMDIHIHAYPDWVHRSQDMVEIAIEASKREMRAILFKDHCFLTAGEAYLVQRHIDHLVAEGALPYAVEVYGGLGLNFGVKPDVVRQAIKYPKMKKIIVSRLRTWPKSLAMMHLCVLIVLIVLMVSNGSATGWYVLGIIG